MKPYYYIQLVYKLIHIQVLCSLITVETIIGDTVIDHEIVYPFIRQTNHKRMRSKRSVDENISNKKIEKLKINFNALGRTFSAKLDLNKRFLTPNFHVEVIGERGEIKHTHGMKNCYFTGGLENENNTLVSISHCNGLHGVIHTSKGKYSIKPFHHEDGNGDGEPASSKYRPHIVKRLIDDLNEPEKSVYNEDPTYRFKRDMEETSSSCGLDDLKPHVRWTRGVMSEKLGEQNIETMITVDQKMAQFYGMDAAKQYALTIANVAHDILRDSTIGPNPVNLVINKLVILTAPLDDLTINHHARNSLASFGKWADKRNNMDKDHPDHYDYSALFTKHDICVDRNQPCETKGLSFVGGMCDGSRSSAIIEDGGFGSAFTLAHQTGHCLGIDHDGVGNTCIGGNRIMSTTGGKAEDAFHWSACSVDYLQQFLRKDQSNCLDNDPPRAKREDISAYDNPGNLYDADVQCRYAIGDQAKACYEDDTDQICVELLCYNPKHSNCSRIGKPAMDGTPCGSGKWCKEAICVFKGLRDDLIVDGGWSQWSGFKPCTRTCGGGISYRERACQSPKPKHGGKYCEGESRMYVVCNKEDCPKSEQNVRKSQCQKQSLAYYEDHLLTWTHEDDHPDSSCELRCHAVNNTAITKYFGQAMDGTDCMISGTFGRCVRGECNTVGCDMLLGSTLRYDRCGECGGNGDPCSNKINLNESALAMSRSINNEAIVEKLADLELKGTNHMENVAKKLLELRGVVLGVAKKKCEEDPECSGKLDQASKKGNIESEPEKFQWVVTTTGCTVSCGRGSEFEHPVCRRIDDGTGVSSNLCDQTKKPMSLTKECQRSPCPPNWTTSKWSACTRSCGGGKKIRSVYCVLNVGTEEYILPTRQCEEKDKPKRVALCNLGSCPAEWFAEPYGECSTSCGQGNRNRLVVCRRIDTEAGTATVVNNQACSHSPIPETDMICNAHKPCVGSGCGSTWSDEEGNITSPLYPHNYPENSECVHEIIGNPGKIILLTFNDINITAPVTQFNGPKCQGDFLRITDGKCSEIGYHPSAVKLCGTEVPGYYRSNDNNLCIKFVSDQTDNAKGFSLRYKIVDKELDNKPVADICDIKGDIINSTLGIITSPNYPHSYPINEDCKTTFTSPDGSGFMLKFDAFQLGTRSGIMDCKNDYLEVFYDDKAQRICGKEPSIPTIHIPATTFTMSFHSSHIKFDSKGFVLTYVTKKYAKTYAVDQRTENNLEAYGQTLNDWSIRQPPAINNNTDSNMLSASAIKKNVIAHNGAIKDKDELIKVLMELSDAKPLQSVKSNDIEVNERKFETRTNIASKSANHNILPSYQSNKRTNVLSTQNNLPEVTTQNINPILNQRKNSLNQPNFKNNAFTENNYLKLPVKYNAAYSPSGQLNKQQPNMITWKNSIPSRVIPSIAPSSKLINQKSRIEHPAVTSEKKTSVKTKPSRLDISDSFSFTKKGQQNTKSDVLQRTNTVYKYPESASKRISLPKVINSDKNVKKVRLVETPVTYETNENFDVKREKTFIPRAPSITEYHDKSVLSKKSNIARPEIPNHTQKYAIPWQQYWQNSAETQAYAKSNVPLWSSVSSQNPFSQPIQSLQTAKYFGAPQPNIAWQHQAFQPTAMYQQPSQSPYVTANSKRQYQSFPFMYVPRFGVLNNHCPPKSSFTCRDIIFHPICTTDKDCIDLRFGCCQTSCDNTRVCVPKHNDENTNAT